MASVGHVAVGMAAARIYGRGPRPPASSMALWSALSLLPDIDVIGFRLGVEYADPWGHRGATHSLTLAVALGLAIGLAARAFTRSPIRVGLFATAVLVSHALLDTMTDGGLGCALLWPFDRTRYFAPWRPIPVAPIGRAFLSPDGLLVFLAELLLFAPALLYAVRPPFMTTRRVTIAMALWFGAVSSMWSSETARDAISGALLREATEYTSGFSEAAFRSVTTGQSQEQVRQILGLPFNEFWFYTPTDSRPPDERPVPADHACLIVRFEQGVVAGLQDADACRMQGVRAGSPRGDVDKQLGSPSESCWQYSKSQGGGHYRERLVCFSHGKVHMIVRKWS
jgi:inner membrane protein